MKKKEIKSLLLFSLALGVVMGFLFFLVGALVLPDGSWLLALWAGVFSAVALFLMLFVVFLRAEKRFSKVRAGINTPILYEVDGFWQKENGGMSYDWKCVSTTSSTGSRRKNKGVFKIWRR